MPAPCGKLPLASVESSNPVMPIIISMLRGINVGGHNIIKMDALRALYESLKLRGAQTAVQSGNVVSQPPKTNLPAIAARTQPAIHKKFGFRPDIILRT